MLKKTSQLNHKDKLQNGVRKGFGKLFGEKAIIGQFQ